MNLANLLTVDQIIPSMRATQHRESIVELVDHLVSSKHLEADCRDEVLEALQEREEKISTGIGSGVAIPHAFSNRTEEVIAVFGRSVEGIDFEALDNAPVHNIVLFVVPQKEYHLHLRTLAAIAKLFTNREVRQRLADAGSSREIHEIFASRPARA
ncbi:MAG: mannitol/fructose-specific phosphotransferase system IIA component (Ntr-type) [Pseudoalteromonas tetraodonis]|jgi:mannitol/fructose-specific phosphotransferase system IIA component (Ntr-type)